MATLGVLVMELISFVVFECRYTPFTTPSLLAEQINVLGTMPGSRMVFWDLRDDLDSLALDSRDNMLYLSSAPDVRQPNRGRCDAQTSRNAESERSAEMRSAAQSDGALAASSSDLTKAGEAQNITNGSTPDEAGPASGENPPSARDPCRPRIDEAAATNAHAGPDMLDVDEDGKPLSPADQPIAPSAAGDSEDRHPEEGVKIEQTTGGSERASGSDDTEGQATGHQKSLPPYFPLWTTARHSPDYCLATYLFWLHLHAPATTHVQGIPLAPQPASYGGRQPKRREGLTDDSAESSTATREQQDSDASAEAKSGLVSSISRPQTALAEKCSADGELLADGAQTTPSLYVFLKQRLYAPVSASPLLVDSQDACVVFTCSAVSIKFEWMSWSLFQFRCAVELSRAGGALLPLYSGGP